MKKTNAKKKLLPAVGMLAISAAMLSSATFAWFTMNKEVQVTNMQVKAVAEDGLLVNEVATAADTHWDNEATAAQTAQTASLLHPASTANGTTWYHAASKKSYDAAAATEGQVSTDLVGGAYTTLSGLTAISSMSDTAVAGTKAFRETMGTSSSAEAGYYVHYTYYLKSAGAAVDLTQPENSLSIKSVTATAGSANSTALNSSLRVGIKLNSQFYIYAPVTGYTTEYYVNADNDATEPIAGTTATATDLATLPAANAAGGGAPVQVYIWYEGEDANCKSDNATATALDNIQVAITFSLTTDDLPDPASP